MKEYFAMKRTGIKLFYLCISLSILCWHRGFAQMEQVYLDLDKYSCNQGDTVRFKAYITQASALSQLPPLSSTSTVLHVNVYTRAGRLLSKQVFPVYRGMTNGQVIFKDSLPTDNYYLVAFTKEQLNYG